MSLRPDYFVNARCNFQFRLSILVAKGFSRRIKEEGIIAIIRGSFNKFLKNLRDGARIVENSLILIRIITH